MPNGITAALFFFNERYSIYPLSVLREKLCRKYREF